MSKNEIIEQKFGESFSTSVMGERMEDCMDEYAQSIAKEVVEELENEIDTSDGYDAYNEGIEAAISLINQKFGI